MRVFKAISIFVLFVGTVLSLAVLLGLWPSYAEANFTCRCSTWSSGSRVCEGNRSVFKQTRECVGSCDTEERTSHTSYDCQYGCENGACIHTSSGSEGSEGSEGSSEAESEGTPLENENPPLTGASEPPFQPLEDSQRSGQQEPSGEVQKGGYVSTYSLNKKLQELEEGLESCKQERNRSIECCDNPLQCITGISGPTTGTIAAILPLIASISMNVSRQESLQGYEAMIKQCEAGEVMSYIATGVNGAIGGFCMIQKGQCRQSCEAVVTGADNLMAQCQTLNPLEAGENCRLFRRFQRQAHGNMEVCENLNPNISAALQGTVQSVAAIKQAELCKEMARKAQEQPELEPESFGDSLPHASADCSNPANASSPLCRLDCQRPGATNDPFCQPVHQNTQNGNGDLSFEKNSDPSPQAEDVNLGIMGDDEDQFASLSSVNPEHLGIIGGGGGGGGGGLGGGSHGGGSGSKANNSSGDGGGKGYNTNILKGHRGRTGYSRKYGSRGKGGGFRGYGSSQGSGAQPSRHSAFDLKSFLPGGKKDPKKRVTHLSSQAGRQIGAPHTNIWQKISHRYRGVCQVGRLRDCGEK